MKCFYCKDTAEEKLKTLTITLDKCVIIVKNVPSLICKQCGEVYFTDDVMQKLEVIADKLRIIIKEVAIVDYADNNVA